ncbi:hypothetical protein HAZT_HAZT006624 [Hyalella azteca]|uniref:Uncharacterized protein n=1 Tax=Hyalella azteca TaxID=294128 RepID=A0A6A0GV35_HYAAZ|nr:hypothetical protein HAZT_HAZT006624 [Hyalella azteca]
MAITDLTINYEREEAVDFTMPFMNLGISIIYKKPQKMAPSLFTPYEWQNPHPCDPEPESLENQFTMVNCMWFAIGSLMQQGCDILPQ